MHKGVWNRPLAAAAVAGVMAAPATAAQETGWRWADKAELSIVVTGGNAESNTLGVKNTLTGESERSKFTIEVGALRTESSLKTRIADGTATDFRVMEMSNTELTAENYFARSRYDYAFSGTAFVFGGAGWERNTFSGVDSRISFVGGAGRIWSNTETFALRTDLGATYTVENPVAIGPSDRFVGVRFTGELARTLTPTTDFESKLIVDESLRRTENLRADFTNAVTVSISDGLALKTSLQVFFDNEPSLTDVPLFNGGVDTGTTVATPLEKVDTQLTVALVINF